MELRQLKTFVTVVNFLSFTKAATELNYAQSTVTGQIQALEEELGIMLFDRVSKQIRLTTEGEHLYAYAVQILKLSSEASDVICSSITPKGSITIGTAESLCLHRLPEVFNTFRTRYPKVELSINFDTGGEYRALLRKNAIDIAFFLDVRCSENDLITHALFSERMSLIAPINHTLAGKQQIYPCDLNNQPLVLTSPGCTYQSLPPLWA